MTEKEKFPLGCHFGFGSLVMSCSSLQTDSLWQKWMEASASFEISTKKSQSPSINLTNYRTPSEFRFPSAEEEKTYVTCWFIMSAWEQIDCETWRFGNVHWCRIIDFCRYFTQVFGLNDLLFSHQQIRNMGHLLMRAAPGLYRQCHPKPGLVSGKCRGLNWTHYV